MIYRGIGLRWRPGVRNETARLVSSATWTSGRTRRGGFRPLRDVARILDRFDRRYVINSSRAARGARAAGPKSPRPRLPRGLTRGPGRRSPAPPRGRSGVYATYVPFRGVSQSVFKKLFIHVILYPARGRAIRHPRLSAASRSCRYASGMPLTVLTRRRRARARSGIRLVFVRLLSLFSLTSTHLCAC